MRVVHSAMSMGRRFEAVRTGVHSYLRTNFGRLAGRAIFNRQLLCINSH